jgi:hypothetical protein
VEAGAEDGDLLSGDGITEQAFSGGPTGDGILVITLDYT